MVILQEAEHVAHSIILTPDETPEDQIKQMYSFMRIKERGRFEQVLH